MGICQQFSFKNSTVRSNASAFVTFEYGIAENIDAATCDMELLDPVNVRVVFGISLLV